MASEAAARGPVIDVHTHLGRERFALTIQVMERVGLQTMVNLSGGFGEGLRQTLAEAERFPGRFVTFCGVDFSGIDEADFGEKQAKELRRSAEAGAQGLKIFKSLGLRLRDRSGQLLAVDDPRLDPLWEEAGELGLPVLIHTADPADFWKPVTPENPFYHTLQARPEWSYFGTDIPPHRELLYQRDRVVERHSETTFVAAHMGDAVEDLEYLACELDKNPHLFLDTSARLNRLGSSKDLREVRNFFLNYQDRLLFGTDCGANFRSQADLPQMEEFYRRHWSFFETAERGFLAPFTNDWHIDGINLPKEVLRKLYWENARRLLKLAG